MIMEVLQPLSRGCVYDALFRRCFFSLVLWKGCVQQSYYYEIYIQVNTLLIYHENMKGMKTAAVLVQQLTP